MACGREEPGRGGSVNKSDNPRLFYVSPKCVKCVVGVRRSCESAGAGGHCRQLTTNAGHFRGLRLAPARVPCPRPAAIPPGDDFCTHPFAGVLSAKNSPTGDKNRPGDFERKVSKEGNYSLSICVREAPRAYC